LAEKKILVAYGTRYGCTEGIAEKIAKILEEKGFPIELVNLDELKSSKWPELKSFRGVLLGTSIKATLWKRVVKKFLKKNRNKLKEESIKFGIFTCGAQAIVEPEKSREMLAEKLREKYEIEPDLYDAFAGVIDFSEDSNVGKTGQFALKAAVEGMMKDFDIEVDMEGNNDFRDWEKIEKFASVFSDMV
jgi:menaquinone-dependent protoporphyrinogen IX oxidase